MAKIEKQLWNDFDDLLGEIQKQVLDGSMTATLEDYSDFVSDHARCSVRVFERYSALGDNRASLSVTLFQEKDGPVHVSAIASGGSGAMLFKINRLGEDAFLDTLRPVLDE
ncbi:MAG: DUF6054 family protein [Christensenellales bacterium]|nr:DUF6054 family protein [Christensenellales bacterium]